MGENEVTNCRNKKCNCKHTYKNMDKGDSSAVKSTCYLLLQRTRVEFLAPTWKVTTISNFRSRSQDTYMHAGKILILLCCGIFWIHSDLESKGRASYWGTKISHWGFRELRTHKKTQEVRGRGFQKFKDPFGLKERGGEGTSLVASLPLLPPNIWFPSNRI